MGDYEVSFDLGGEHNDVVIVSCYKDKFAIISGIKGKCGVVFKRWCHPRYRTGPGEKAIPMQVVLGSRSDAIRFARFLLEHLDPYGNAAEGFAILKDAKGEVYDEEAPF